MESLLTVQLNREGVYVYVAKVWSFMKIKTDEGKEYYNLWFILEGRGTIYVHNLHNSCTLYINFVNSRSSYCM